MEQHRFEIRRATIDDLDFIVASNMAMAIETEGTSLDPEVASSGVRNGLSDPERSQYFLAECNGQVVGQTMITTEWSDWRNGFCWWIQSVYVVPEFRRKGVFRAIYRHIRELARGAEDVCGIRLYVHNENQRAFATYRELGMTETAYRMFEDVWPVPKA